MFYDDRLLFVRLNFDKMFKLLLLMMMLLLYPSRGNPEFVCDPLYPFLSWPERAVGIIEEKIVISSSPSGSLRFVDLLIGYRQRCIDRL